MDAEEKPDSPQAPRGRGRPTSLTPEVADAIVMYISHGSYIETAVAAQGLSRNVFYEWMKRGRKGEPGDEEFVNFAERVDKALAEAEFKDILRIEKAANKTWQAAAWRLERRYPERWAKREHHAVTQENRISFVTKVGADGVVFREQMKSDTDPDDQVVGLDGN